MKLAGAEDRPRFPSLDEAVPALVKSAEYGRLRALFQRDRLASPGSAGPWRNLGVLAGAAGHWTGAVRCFRAALRRAPEDGGIWSDLGKALLAQGRHTEAVGAQRQALRLAPDDVSVRLRMATAQSAAGDQQAALATCRDVVRERPDLAQGWRTLCRLAYVSQRHFEALEAWQRYQELRPAQSPTDWAAMASLQFNAGNTENCLAAARRAIDAAPMPPMFHSGYLSTRLHSINETVENTRLAAEEWGRHHAPPAPSAKYRPRSAVRRRLPLRIGYVTQEFRKGPAIHFLLPLLENRSRDGRFIVYGYHCDDLVDEWTRFAERCCDHWRHLPASESELAGAIRRDRIDVLVDLSGHYGSRLRLFQDRHAPVQMTLPDYPGTTGARAMDYILTDRWVCPEGREKQYTEKPFWLTEGYLPYRAPLRPPLQPCPADTAGTITFGLFQRPSKLNAAVWDAVARVLKATPRSRLLMHYGSVELNDPESLACSRLRRELTARGIAASRIEFQGSATLPDHLRLVAATDIALDSFPYNGQTTTCECLWMGVPVVTLRGDLHVARVSWEILDQAGVPELAADTSDGFVEIAARLARDSALRQQYRRTLRSALRRSAMMNGAVVRGIESAYEGALQSV